MTIESRPLPDVTDPDFAPFWEACGESRLVVQRCVDCETLRWPPRPCCSACGSVETAWPEVEGHAELYSWTTIWHPYDPSFADDVPYTVAVVELAAPAGIRFIGRLRHDDETPLAVGDRCGVEFDQVADGVRLPVWRRLS